MDIHGFKIETSNVTFKQKEPIIIRIQGTHKKNQVFPVFYFMNNLTGKYSHLEEKVISKHHRGIDGTYYNYDMRIDFQYDEIANCIVVFLLKLSTRNVKLGIPCLYEEQKRFYITPNKGIIYYKPKVDSGGEWIHISKITKKSDLPFDITEYNHINDDGENSVKEEIGNCMAKLFNRVVTLAGNRAISLETSYNIVDFLLYKEPCVRKGPLQKKIDEYGAIEMPEYIPDPNINQMSPVFTEGRLIKLKDDLLCLQMFNVLRNRQYFYEGYRMYISTDGTIITCKKNNFNQFVPTTSNLGGSHWRFAIYQYDEKAVEGTQLAYYKSIINDIPVASRGYAIWCFLNYDIFEKLYKAGLKDFLNHLFAKAYDEPMGTLADFWNVPISNLTNSKNIYSALNINRYQMEKFIEATKDCNKKYGLTIAENISIIRSIKYILSGEFSGGDISPIDNETFDTLFEFLQKIRISSISDTVLDVMRKINLSYSTKTLFNTFDTINMILNKGYYYDIRNYNDYISMVVKMEATSIYKPKFSTLEDMKTAHDNITCLYNLKKNEYKAKEFKEAVKKTEALKYNDKKYTIIIPKTPDDMVKEGNELHHCVKNYIEKVINGTTNIVFLRKMEEPDTPFFTIEVSNDGVVEQIHGLQNRNMSTEPDIEYFVKDWTNKKKLKMNRVNKLR